MSSTINYNVLMGVWYGYSLESITHYLHRRHALIEGIDYDAPQTQEDATLGYLRAPAEMEMPLPSLKSSVNVRRYCPTPMRAELPTLDDYELLVEMVDSRHSGLVKTLEKYQQYLSDTHPELGVEPLVINY